MVVGLFPPMGGSGVQRTLKFCKYLPQFGWQPIVLTVNSRPQNERDATLLEELPKLVRIHRTSFLDLYVIFRWAKQSLGQGKNPGWFENARNGDARAMWYTSIRRFIEAWVFIPDSYIGWFPFALAKGYNLVRRLGIDVIYSSSDPFTDHLIAYCLKKLLGKPWIADFRDLWTQETFYQHVSFFRQRLDDQLERTFLASADRIIVASYPMVDFFLRKHPSVERAKFLEITNGFDPDDFQGLRAVRNLKHFRITFTGRFSLEKSFSLPFLKAIRELVNENLELATRLKVVLVGYLGERERQLIKRLSLEQFVDDVGYVSHRRSVELLHESDVLLLTNNPGPAREVYYTGKLFEYLAARKPILALTEDGVAAQLVRRTNAGVVVPPHDVKAIKQAIVALYEQPNIQPEPRPWLRNFERKVLTQSLAGCLNEVAMQRTRVERSKCP